MCFEIYSVIASKISFYIETRMGEDKKTSNFHLVFVHVLAIWQKNVVKPGVCMCLKKRHFHDAQKKTWFGMVKSACI